MQSKPVRITLSAIVVFCVAIFRMLLFALYYYSMQLYNEKHGNQLPLSTSINFTLIFPPVILTVESLVYFIFRKREYRKRYVLLHVWFTLLSSFLLPLVQLIVEASLYKYLKPDEIAALGKRWGNMLFLFGWGLFWLSRILFLIAMIKSKPGKINFAEEKESEDFLNEFNKA